MYILVHKQLIIFIYILLHINSCRKTIIIFLNKSSSYQIPENILSVSYYHF